MPRFTLWVVCAVLVAITVVPVLCRLLLRNPPQPGEGRRWRRRVRLGGVAVLAGVLFKLGYGRIMHALHEDPGVQPGEGGGHARTRAPDEESLP